MAERFRRHIGETKGRLAQWIDEALPVVTRRYAALHAEGGATAARV